MQFIIIDDEPINHLISKMLLSEMLDCREITSFTNGADALRFLQHDFNCNSGQPTVLLLDLNMPIISGWDFLELFDLYKQGLKNSVKIYILSSSIDPGDRNKAMANPNVISFLSKPLTEQLIKDNFYNYK